MLKRCSSCGVEKGHDQFGKHRRNLNGLGRFSDSPELLRRAASYIEVFK